ncbi:MAG: SpvB/TcaC N-terminal domain-containing protein [Bacteroidales bacterium]
MMLDNCDANINIADSLRNEDKLLIDTIYMESGDTIYRYYYNRYDYGEISILPSQHLDNNDEINSSGVAALMNISTTNSIDNSKYVGEIPYQEAVTPSGAKVYSVPIVTAPICAEPPQVNVSYNSQTGNGVAGYGWNISGLSSISVVPKNNYYDEEVSAIDLSDESKCVYALDGVRLVNNIGDLSNEYQYENSSRFYTR